MGNFMPVAGCGATKILRKSPTVQNGAVAWIFYLPCDRLTVAAGIVSAIAGERVTTHGMNVTRVRLPN
jgi:hypothetical protein